MTIEDAEQEYAAAIKRLEAAVKKYECHVVRFRLEGFVIGAPKDTSLQSFAERAYILQTLGSLYREVTDARWQAEQAEVIVKYFRKHA